MLHISTFFFFCFWRCELNLGGEIGIIRLIACFGRLAFPRLRYILLVGLCNSGRCGCLIVLRFASLVGFGIIILRLASDFWTCATKFTSNFKSALILWFTSNFWRLVSAQVWSFLSSSLDNLFTFFPEIDLADPFFLLTSDCFKELPPLLLVPSPFLTDCFNVLVSKSLVVSLVYIYIYVEDIILHLRH